MSSSESKPQQLGQQSPVVRRTSNHIYGHCSAVTVLGMEADSDVQAVLQLGHDIVELSDGSSKTEYRVSTVRHTFATVTLNRQAAEQLFEALSGMLGKNKPRETAK